MSPAPPSAAPEFTGLGVVSGAGVGKAALREALYAGTSLFGPLTREGRTPPEGVPGFVGVELPELPPLEPRFPRRLRRNTSLTGQAAVYAVAEAWAEAGLDALDPERVGLVVGGSNLQARPLWLTHEARRGARMAFLRPHFGLGFLDTDVCGLLCEVFGVRGLAFTVGGASASGALAVARAAELVRSGRVDACVAVGALQDLSCLELQGFRAMGALASGDDALADPSAACRPFDRGRQGFVFGEMCGALVLRRPGHGQPRYGRLTGAWQTSDGARSPSPSAEGELKAIQGALRMADLEPIDISYVNTHGTGSPLGDDTEAEALVQAGLAHARVNASKATLGHGLSAAGAVELVVTLLQMQDARLHPTRNLARPIRPELAWVGPEPEAQALPHALSLSFGFGGVNLALVVSAPEASAP